MEPSYSVVADALSKFHTSSEWIQALWLVMVPVTVLGMTWLVMRGLTELASILFRRRKRGSPINGIYQDARGRPVIERRGHEPVDAAWTDPPPAVIPGPCPSRPREDLRE